ncbi:glycosyltransferase family 4 protein [Microbacterium sp. Marseille-Q6965]|uniref:glycosyltransferase family 4 protein n=1 Tax=Microbacterium sp. Marseille-Q6965 TaxID=2965072 RepID=UPI0021B71DC6|nr:glycosyltransferase family 4 protein [Microbacterium sp. Marseille-Q6965]
MSARRLRVGLVQPHRGAITPDLWSGTPHGLLGGLRQHGADVVEIGYDVPRAVTAPIHLAATLRHREPGAAEHDALKMAAREAAFTRAILRRGPLDLVLATGTDAYRLDRVRTAGAMVATYDDATLQSMWAHEHSDTRAAGFRAAAVARWIAVQRRSSRRADLNLVSTRWAAETLRADYGIPADRVHVVGMGHRPRATARRPARGAAPVFLFVGVDWRRKNGERVLEAFQRVRAVRPDAVLHLVGRHDRVEAPGVVDHGLLPRHDARAQAVLDGLYAQATAFVLPSLFDPSPIAYLEAASAGLPVIATSQGGASEMLGTGAIVVDPWDERALHAAMLALCDRREAQRRGAAAREAASRATWADVAERILETVREHPRVSGGALVHSSS